MNRSIHSSIRLVCFDLGGVLIRICRSWPEGCAAAGIEVRGEYHNGYLQIQGWDELGVQFGTGRIDGEEWSRQISALASGLYTPEEIRSIHDAWLLGEYAGMSDVIDRIHAAGLQTAALSNTNQDHWSRILMDYPIVARLHHALASHELGLLKPDPAIYKEFQRRTKHDASEILFFDDLLPNIEAARAAGWVAELIDPGAPTDVQVQEALRRHRVLHDSNSKAY